MGTWILWYATCIIEIIKELPTVDYILVPVGGGGLATGVSTLAKLLNPDVAAAVVSLLLINLYNGKRGLKLKYFFYIFYPAHLALLYGVSLIVLNCL